MTRILIRCDASLSIGSGHVIRCRTLARELKKRGCEVIFLCRRQSGDLISLLEQEFLVLALPEQPLTLCDGLDGRDLYAAWLGCSQDQDASQCIQLLSSACITNASWLVVDHYGLDACWEERLRVALAGAENSPQLLVIDDLADRQHVANLLLDQNFFGELTETRYQSLLSKQCRQLLGPHYALLGPEYAQLNSLIPCRSEVRRILVYFGAVDSLGLTEKVLKVLNDPTFVELAVDVVLNTNSPNFHAVSEIVACRANTTLYSHLPSLAGLISRADLGIGACGTTTWERSCLGLPSLGIVIAANQLSFAKALHEAGHLLLVGENSDVGVNQIRIGLLSLMADVQLGKYSRVLTDGWGASRLVMAMLGLEGAITLRQATAADEPLLSRWADSQYSVVNFSTQTIQVPDYYQPLHKHSSSTSSQLFIAMSEKGCPVGEFSFDMHDTTADASQNEVMVHLSLDRCVRGYKLTAELVRLGLQVIEQRCLNSAKGDSLIHNTYDRACYSRISFHCNLQMFPLSKRAEVLIPWH